MATVRSLTYHGIKPPTKEDAAIGRKHLDMTDKVVDKKIDEHDEAYSKAKKLGNKQSAKYHLSHLKKHKSEKKDIKVSKHTIDLIKGSLPHLGASK